MGNFNSIFDAEHFLVVSFELMQDILGIKQLPEKLFKCVYIDIFNCYSGASRFFTFFFVFRNFGQKQAGDYVIIFTYLVFLVAILKFNIYPGGNHYAGIHYP